MYLNRSSVRTPVDARNVFEGMLSRKESCDSPAGYWNSLMQRPLYRFVLRTFFFCPMGADIKNIAQVFSAWMVYMEPWKVQQEDLDEYDLTSLGGRNVCRVSDGKRQECDAAYSQAWQSFVLSNYLFYRSLVVHFLGFAHKFIHSDVASVLQMVSKVLEVLAPRNYWASSTMLMLLIILDFLVLCHVFWILCSSMCHQSVSSYRTGKTDCRNMMLMDLSCICLGTLNLRLFSFDEDGAYNLLQLLLLRAESEIQRLPGDAMRTLQTLDAIKSNMKKVFYKHVESSQAKSLPEGEHKQHHGCGEVFTPKHPSLGKSSLADMKYRGDWMMRPISDTEVAWPARTLIRFAACLNETLRLHADADATPAGPTIIKFDRNEPSRVGGQKDAARMALVGVFTLLVWWGNGSCSS